MTPVHLVAAALKSRGAYQAILDSGEAAVLPEELVAVWLAIQKFYECDADAKQTDPEIIAAYASEGLSNPKHADAIKRTVARLGDTPVSGSNIRELLRMVAGQRAGDAVAQAIATRKPSDQILPLIREYERITQGTDEEDDQEIDWPQVLATRLNPEGRIKVAPAALNEYLGGGLLPGRNVTIFARPEAGKTALAITMACGFARRGHRVLYAINEDPAADLMVRAMSNVTRRNAEQMLADPEGTIKLGLSKGISNLVMRDISPGSMGELSTLVRRYQPKVLIVDQMRNLKTSKLDNYTQGLDHIAQGLRALAKQNGIVTIGITQAGDSASGRPVLEMGDIDSSNTGIPGAADVLIGMGVTDTLRNAGQRVLSISKNKVSGRHGYFTVNIDEATSRVFSHA